MKKLFGVLTLMFLFASVACSPSCGAAQDAKTVGVDVVKCAVQFPGDAVEQVVSLVQKLRGSPDFITALVSWAEAAKDSQFAACVFVSVVADIKKSHEQANSSLAGSTEPNIPELEQAYEKFRAKRFGNTQFEPALPKQ